MSPEELNVRKAIADVELIRRVLDQAEKSDTPAQTVGLFGVTLTANIILQSIALAGAALLLIIELSTRGAITELLMLGATLPDIRLLGIGLMAGILIGLVILLYFVIWRAARNNREEFNAYIVRNFRYARLLSYLSDLLLKFAAVALVARLYWRLPRSGSFVYPTDALRSNSGCNLYRYRALSVSRRHPDTVSTVDSVYRGRSPLSREINATASDPDERTCLTRRLLWLRASSSMSIRHYSIGYASPSWRIFR